MYVVASTARYAKLTISGSEVVKFPRQFNVFGVKGDNITVALTPNASGDGVYNTADGDGSILIAHYSNINTMYLTGSGDVIVWAGNNPDDCPFKSGAKGGGSGGDGTHFVGTTTTALSDGATTNPITVDGESYTAVKGDIVIYNSTEFIFDGSAWQLFGGTMDTQPTKNSAKAVTSDGVYRYTAGQKEYTNNILRGEIFNTYSGNDKNIASGDGSHAEGQKTYASGVCAHAEGYNTQATKNWSHAEGVSTVASGYYSHAGGIGTQATEDGMTAIGKFNNPKANSLFEIGNGSQEGSTTLHSNILEVSDSYLNVNGDIKKNGVSISPLVYDAQTESFVFGGVSNG